mmetsp:Transcript_6230/g.12948  ORF Transcript_6230/g.12948 Transcript_6230/m.12948 type:complete len:225 (+) Transcript_6230:1733-2407(+)
MLSLSLLMMSSMSFIRPSPSSQFCSSTQVPFTQAALMALKATGSCPSPREMTAGGGNFFFLHSVSMASVGSAPRLRRTMTGTCGVMVSYIMSNVSVTGSTKAGPISLVPLKNSLHVRMHLSTLKLLTSRSLRNGPMSVCSAILCSYSGIAICSGSLSSYQRFHIASLAIMSVARLLKNLLLLLSSMILSQTSLLIQVKGFLLTLLMSRAAPPLRNRVTSLCFSI